MQNGTAAEKKVIRAAIEDDDHAKLEDILAIIESTGALDYTRQRAQEAADMAIESALADIPGVRIQRRNARNRRVFSTTTLLTSGKRHNLGRHAL